jgi:hypothetical protein
LREERSAARRDQLFVIALVDGEPEDAARDAFEIDFDARRFVAGFAILVVVRFRILVERRGFGHERVRHVVA